MLYDYRHILIISTYVRTYTHVGLQLWSEKDFFYNVKFFPYLPTTSLALPILSHLVEFACLSPVCSFVCCLCGQGRATSIHLRKSHSPKAAAAAAKIEHTKRALSFGFLFSLITKDSQETLGWRRRGNFKSQHPPRGIKVKAAETQLDDIWTCARDLRFNCIGRF